MAWKRSRVQVPYGPPLDDLSKRHRLSILCLSLFLHRGIEQLAARQAHNLEVVGSSPTPATNPG